MWFADGSDRDIYYRDPVLFSKQAVVDRFVDDLAFTFGVPRMLMNVVRWWLDLLVDVVTNVRADCHGKRLDRRSLHDHPE